MYCWLAKAQAHLFTINISLISLIGTGGWLREPRELTTNTSPGKGHEGQSSERLGKEMTQESLGVACHQKSYFMSCRLTQSVCRMSYVEWKLSCRDQPLFFISAPDYSSLQLFNNYSATS